MAIRGMAARTILFGLGLVGLATVIARRRGQAAMRPAL
jgi:hypothetical protein